MFLIFRHDGRYLHSITSVLIHGRGDPILANNHRGQETMHCGARGLKRGAKCLTETDSAETLHVTHISAWLEDVVDLGDQEFLVQFRNGVVR